MNTKNYPVENFKEGMYMLYFITSQTAATVSVTIQDGNGNQYAQFDSDGNTDPMSKPAQGFVRLSGDNLSVTITNSSGTKEAIRKSFSLNNPDNGEAAVFNWVCATEDGSDADFNDVWISLAAWKTKG